MPARSRSKKRSPRWRREPGGRGGVVTVAVRVIPCLDVDGGRVVKGVNFRDLRDAGDPVELAAAYDGEGADELVFLDITAAVARPELLTEVAGRFGAQCVVVSVDARRAPEGGRFEVTTHGGRRGTG